MENKDYIRDARSKAILNVNHKGLEEYRSTKDQASRMKRIEEELEQTRSDMSDIKNLLLKLTEKNG